MTVCSVSGCSRRARCRGWCCTHYSRWQRLGDVQADRPIGWRLEIVHGTYDGYANHRCRCRECTTAHTQYIVARDHRLGRTRPLADYLAEVMHGRDGYRKRGCRCDVCVAGMANYRNRDAEAKRRKRARRKLVGTRG